MIPNNRPKRQPNSYHDHANALLVDMGVNFSVTLIGNSCPPFCKDASREYRMYMVDVYPRSCHIHGNHYRVMFSRKRGTSEVTDDTRIITFNFWNSYADAELLHLGTKKYREGRSVYKYREAGFDIKPRVEAYDVLACLSKLHPGSFMEFCSDFGYDTDSRLAEHTYDLVCKEYSKMAKFFTASELERLQEVA